MVNILMLNTTFEVIYGVDFVTRLDKLLPRFESRYDSIPKN